MLGLGFGEKKKMFVYYVHPTVIPQDFFFPKMLHCFISIFQVRGVPLLFTKPTLLKTKKYFFTKKNIKT